MNKLPLESPFGRPEKRLTFGMDWILLVMLVAATTAMLVGYALFLPSVTSEVYAWLGIQRDAGEVSSNRRAQIIFLLLCYAAPMILGLVARLLHVGGRILAERLEQANDEDDEFRME